jgi:hypothetical protein
MKYPGLINLTPLQGAASPMAKPNYAFEKRQKELAKKQKKLEKLEQRKTSGSHDADAETEAENGADIGDTPPHPPSAD